MRKVPAAVWWITAVHLCLLLVYSLLAPTYRAPDEPEHVDLAHLFATTGEYPAWDERDVSPGIARTKDLVRFDTGSVDLTAGEARPKDQRPAIDELEEPPAATRPNQLPQHPPLYYALAGGVERAAELVLGNPSYDLEVWLYRVVSIVLVAPLPLITWLTAQRLGLPRPLGIAAAGFPLAIPQLSHIGSVVNNDSLMILLFWLVTPLVIALARGDLRPRVALLAGVVTGLALFTKGFALVMPLWVAAALAVALGRAGRERLRAVGVAAGVYAAAALALGGWWWLRNLVAYGNPMPTRYYEVIRPTPDVDRDYGHFLDIWARLSTRLFWGTFGWVDVSIPEAVWHTATAVCVVALLLACIRPDRLAGIPIGDRLLLLAPLLLLMGIQLALSLRAYVNRGLLAGMQGRYWFGALVGIGILIALGLGGLRRSWARWLPAGTLAAAAAMQAVGITTMLDHYWGGPQASLGDRLRAVVAWAPLPGELIGAGALAATVAVAGLGVVVVREAAGWGGPQSKRSTSRLTASASSPDTQAMSPMPVTQATSVDHHT